MLSAAVVGTVLYGRVPDYPGILNSSSDPTKGPNSPHYEVCDCLSLIAVSILLT